MLKNRRPNSGQQNIRELAAAELRCSKIIAQARANKTALMRKCQTEVSNELENIKIQYEDLYQRQVQEAEVTSELVLGTIDNKFDVSMAQMKRSYEKERRATLAIIIETVLKSSMPEIHRNQTFEIENEDDMFEITKF